MTNSEIPSQRLEGTNLWTHLRSNLGYIALAVLYSVLIGLGMGSLFALMFFYGIGMME